MPLLGAMHLHSTYSDGEFTLDELRDCLREAGCRFACMTDHAESFDAAKLEEYITQCRHLSSDDFLFVPGLEFSCREKMHVLGYGVPHLLELTEPEEVFSAIRRLKGVAVVAHPKDSHFEWIESFKCLPDGIEAWNTKYDGRHAPRPQTFALITRLQKKFSRLRAFYGIDLHWRPQYRGLLVELQTDELSREAIIKALIAGAFQGRVGELILPASGAIAPEVMARFRRRYYVSSRLRKLAGGVKGVIERCGGRVPQRLKDRLRRLF